MGDTLIHAAAVFIPLMTAVVWLGPAARRAIGRLGAAGAVTAAERDVDVAERRHRLAVSSGLIDEETAREKARLEAETAQYETDRQAAGEVLAEAVEARRRVIAARAEAETALAFEAARAALGEQDLMALGEAYAAFCREYGYMNVPTFDQWIGDFRGLSR